MQIQPRKQQAAKAGYDSHYFAEIGGECAVMQKLRTSKMTRLHQCDAQTNSVRLQQTME